MAHSISKMLRKYSQMIRSTAHSCCNRDPVLERHLDGPLHLQDVAEVLADDQVYLVQDQHLKGLSQLVLDLGFDRGSQVEGASLGDAPSNNGSPLPSHLLCSVARCLVDFCKFTCAEINQAACNTAKKVAGEWGTIVAGGITQTGTFNLGSSVKSKVQNELRKALEVLILNKVDLIICEYFRNILEMEWAIEV